MEHLGVCFYDIEQNGFTRQIKTENLNDSPHSGSSHKTCHLTQGSPVPGGHLTGELPSLHPLPQLVLMSGSHLSSPSSFLLSQAQSGHQALLQPNLLSLPSQSQTGLLPHQPGLALTPQAMGRSGLAGSSMDGHLDMSHLQVPKHVGSPQDEPSDLEELEQFAKAFKQRRIKLGFTQLLNSVVDLIQFSNSRCCCGCRVTWVWPCEELYCEMTLSTTISRFEALSMLKLQKHVQAQALCWKNVGWKDAENSPSDSMTSPTTLPPLMEGYGRKRKKRTSIETNIKLTLEKRFLDNPKPNSEEITIISEQLSMEKEVVRVWFCNRRQKEKRIYCPISSSPIKSHNYNPRLPSTSRSFSPLATGGVSSSSSPSSPSRGSSPSTLSTASSPLTSQGVSQTFNTTGSWYRWNTTSYHH
ncbi:hypothetical protein cypCar_00027107 [Cyprinus carpio]|nr:hypothetical protein cypCar_00027107 [Cyprinus carpio]